MPGIKTMIIVWSWNAGSLGEGEWLIAGTAHAGNRILCLDWPTGERKVKRLQELTLEWEEKGEVMVFLHRQHGYHVEEIRQMSLASTAGRTSFYLFGEGGDPIYLTRDARGLLGTAGTFSAKVNVGGRLQVPVTAVADRERREIKAAHFEYIWQLYQHALHSRIYELQEDLFSGVREILPRSVFEPGEFYQYLRKQDHQLLLWRVLSFVGRLREGSELARQLRAAERQTGRSLSFDDCGVRLENAYGPEAAGAYTELADNIRQNILSTGEEVNLKQLRGQFESLLKLIN